MGRVYSRGNGDRFSLSGMKDQLLRSPIEQLGDVDLVLRWTGQLVDPTELLQDLAGASQPAEDFTVQCQLVDPARKGIGDVKVLGRSWRNAQRPRRARTQCPVASRGGAGFRRPIADGNGCIAGRRYIDAQNR